MESHWSRDPGDPSRSYVIDWKYPEPRNAVERFIGPGATPPEVILQLGLPILFAAVLAALAATSWGWTPLQTVAAAVIAFDTLGGVITNATGAAKRWYHRSGQTRLSHLGFVALHAIQLAIITLLFPELSWSEFLIAYSYLLIASAVILWAPMYLQRPVSLICLAAGIGLSLYAVNLPLRLEWFLPLFYVKIFASHLPREVPYRPAPSESP